MNRRIQQQIDAPKEPTGEDCREGIRIQLLQELFAEEMARVDDTFFSV